MAYSLLALDTDHIKRYVFATNKLKEIRGASSLLDRLNRADMVELAKKKPYHVETIFAHGGSALFLVDVEPEQAEELGKAIQRLYHEQTGGGASITYAVQPVPYDGEQGMQTLLEKDVLSGNVTMAQVLDLLGVRLDLAKNAPPLQPSQEEMGEKSASAAPGEEQQSAAPAEKSGKDSAFAPVALPSYVLLSTCQSCGRAYAEWVWFDKDDPDDPEGLYCQSCFNKREEDKRLKDKLYQAQNPLAEFEHEPLWGRILRALLEPKDCSIQPYELPSRNIRRPKDFNVFAEFAQGKDYLGLVYADANGMGKAMARQPTLAKRRELAQLVDDAVFQAMGDAIREHLRAQKEKLPFDILLVGGDDIVMVVPAAQALKVAQTLAERFEIYTKRQVTLSVGVVLAPVKYPFGLQRQLAEETLKAAKKAGAVLKAEAVKEAGAAAMAPAQAQASQPAQENNQPEAAHINFVVVMGNTSLSYEKIYEQMHQYRVNEKEEFSATLRPYTLPDFVRLLKWLQEGKEEYQLGRTKLHQLREAVLKFERSKAMSVLDGLLILRNFRKDSERDFLKGLVNEYDSRETPQQGQQGTLFPWALDGERSKPGPLMYYRTPLLDFVELYDFVP